jgi:hypothetical protein
VELVLKTPVGDSRGSGDAGQGSGVSAIACSGGRGLGGDQQSGVRSQGSGVWSGFWRLRTESLAAVAIA